MRGAPSIEAKPPFISRKAPGTYIHAGSSDGKATSYPHHNEHFDLAEDSYHYAAALAVQYTMDYLGVNLS